MTCRVAIYSWYWKGDLILACFVLLCMMKKHPTLTFSHKSHPDYIYVLNSADSWCTMRGKGSHANLVFCPLCLLIQGFDQVCPCLCSLFLVWPTHSQAGRPSPGAHWVAPTSSAVNASLQQCTAPSDLWVEYIIKHIICAVFVGSTPQGQKVPYLFFIFNCSFNRQFPVHM